MRSFFLLLLSSLLVFPACTVVDSVFGSEADSEVTLFPILLNGRWGYINAQGAIIIEANLQNAAPFSEGLAAVQHEWSWKYVNTEGEFLIDEDFQNIRSFSEGKAAVQMDRRWGYINKDGAFVVNPRFREAHAFSNNRAFVRTLDYQDYIYIDENGVKIEAVNTPNDMDFIEESRFFDQRALVRDNDLYGYIDPTGNTIIGLQYSEALPFSEQKAAVLVSDRWGFIDTQGSLTISPQFISAGRFNNGLAPARRNSNEFGFIDPTGVFIIAEQFTEVRTFSEERAAVKFDDKWTFIDKTGNTITKPQFDEVSAFEGGLARITMYSLNDENELEERYGYINKSGDYVWYPTN